jgi:hypothetical protein
MSCQRVMPGIVSPVSAYRTEIPPPPPDPKRSSRIRPPRGGPSSTTMTISGGTSRAPAGGTVRRTGRVVIHPTKAPSRRRGRAGAMPARRNAFPRPGDSWRIHSHTARNPAVRPAAPATPYRSSNAPAVRWAKIVLGPGVNPRPHPDKAPIIQTTGPSHNPAKRRKALRQNQRDQGPWACSRPRAASTQPRSPNSIHISTHRGEKNRSGSSGSPIAGGQSAVPINAAPPRTAAPAGETGHSARHRRVRIHRNPSMKDGRRINGASRWIHVSSAPAQ